MEINNDIENPYVDREELLRMTPQNLAEYVKDIYDNGHLDSFLELLVNDYQLIALLSYWEKYFPEYIRKIIDCKFSEKLKNSELKNELPFDLLNRYSQKELELIFSRLGAVQLTFGCSSGCKFCGFDAVPVVRDEFSFSSLENMFKNWGKHMNEKNFKILYYASEPSDYSKYPEVHKLVVDYAGIYPHITTSKMDQSWVDYIAQNICLMQNGVRFSIKEGDLDLCNLSEDLSHPTIKLNGADVRLNVQSPLTYAIDRTKHQQVGAYTLLDGSHNSQFSGIGCLHGEVLITPRGIYNCVQVSDADFEKHPQQQKVIPIGKISDQDITAEDDLDEILQNSIIVDYCRALEETFDEWCGCVVNCMVVYRKNGYFRMFFYNDSIIKVEKLTNDEINFYGSEEEREGYFQNIFLAGLNEPNLCVFNEISGQRAQGEQSLFKQCFLKQGLEFDIVNFLRNNPNRFKRQKLKKVVSGISGFKWQAFIGPDDIEGLTYEIEVFLEYSPYNSTISQLQAKWEFLHKKANCLEKIDSGQFETMMESLKNEIINGKVYIDLNHYVDYESLFNYLNENLNNLSITSVYKRAFLIFCRISFIFEGREFDLKVQYDTEENVVKNSTICY